MRNRELGVFCVVLFIISAAGTAAGFYVSPAAGTLCGALSLLLAAWAILFTLWRYREIKRLSASLAAATGSGQVLDVRTNREGELSILRNDIYKATSALAGQAKHLRKDKIFLANALGDISHQLKTPLTSLLVHSDLLQEDSLPPEKRREFLNSMSTQLERVRWLVSSLLKLSRVDAAVVDFKKEKIALHSFLAATTAPLLPLAEQKAISLSIECPRNLHWYGDPNWTQEAIGNLIKNCLEHAPKGGNVNVRCFENPLHLQLLVEDNGPGFSKQDLPNLFHRFYRGQNPTGEGVGIGLAMAKSILQAQRADIWAENRPQGGARFVVKLYP